MESLQQAESIIRSVVNRTIRSIPKYSNPVIHKAQGILEKEISEVNTAADGISKSNAQVNDNAKELSDLAGQLNDRVGKFTI
jgi:methyl-accepting chemotaxis protein